MTPSKQLSAATRVELKVCDRCGGLWLRPSDSVSGNCQPCVRTKALLAAEGRTLA